MAEGKIHHKEATASEEAVFSRYPAFVREFIFSRGWERLHPVQLGAAETIFETDHHLLIPSSTASGKTEAAFFPILAELVEHPSSSVAVLYVAPLKSLINDQFGRIEELLDMTGIPVFHWHGDVAGSHKAKLLRDPGGILQITPESLESILMNRSNDIPRLFGDLRYIILDEIHTLAGRARGSQILCQLARIERLIGKSPRRIGLSATLGDTDLAARWLAGETDRDIDVLSAGQERLVWRLGLEHFFIQNDFLDQASDAPVRKVQAPVSLDPGYEYMYDCVHDTKSLVFSNSREETEYLTATFRQIAKSRGEEDVFLIHHGNLSASLREEAEAKMKDDAVHAVTCATVTMELGIDIGRLERILQSGSPISVSSFLQRLGRSGRRGTPPEMMMVFREENPLPNAPLPQLIPWELLRAIAIIQLYIEERFIEPPMKRHLPFGLLFQQTLSILASSGSLSAKALAERVLAMAPFSEVTPEDYKTLLLSMLNNDFLEMTDERELIVGLRGERLTNSFQFYAVFKDSEDFTVRAGSDEIGTITTPPPVGDRFALAGRVWEVEELDIPRKLIYVHAVEGKMEISWPGDYGEIHTRILERMRRVLEEDTVYPYLKENAVRRLEAARAVARNTGMTETPLVPLGGYSYCLFPWLGTRSFRTLRKYIAHHSAQWRISDIEFESCNYIKFKCENGDALLPDLVHRILTEGIDLDAIVGATEAPLFDKYDEYVPAELLRRSYIADRLRTDEIEIRMREFSEEEK